MQWPSHLLCNAVCPNLLSRARKWHSAELCRHLSPSALSITWTSLVGWPKSSSRCSPYNEVTSQEQALPQHSPKNIYVQFFYHSACMCFSFFSSCAPKGQCWAMPEGIQPDTPTRVPLKNGISFTRLLIPAYGKLKLTTQRSTLPLKKRRRPALTCPPTSTGTSCSYLSAKL